MKKLILLIVTIFSITSAFAQVEGAGELEGSQTVYEGSTFTYLVDVKQHDPGTGLIDDTYDFQIFDDVKCETPITDAAIVGKTSYAKDGDNKIGVTVNWEVSNTYYLRVQQTGAHGCYNLKTYTVTVNSSDDMNFAFGVTDADCAVNLTETAKDFNVTLSGASIIHEPGRAAEIFYEIATTNGSPVVAKYAAINTKTTENGAGDYTFTIIADELLLDAAKLNTDGEFTITVTKFKDGAGTEKTLTPAAELVWTAHGLPAISTITFK